MDEKIDVSSTKCTKCQKTAHQFSSGSSSIESCRDASCDRASMAIDDRRRVDRSIARSSITVSRARLRRGARECARGARVGAGAEQRRRDAVVGDRLRRGGRRARAGAPLRGTRRRESAPGSRVRRGSRARTARAPRDRPSRLQHAAVAVARDRIASRSSASDACERGVGAGEVVASRAAASLRATAGTPRRAWRRARVAVRSVRVAPDLVRVGEAGATRAAAR